MAMSKSPSQFAAEDALSVDCMDLNCYLCASPCTRLFRKVRNHTLLICSECGLVYRQTRLNGAGISVDQRKFLDEYLREEGLYARYFNDKLRVIERCRPTGSLLDFGCGAGTFLRCARERGWEVVGVEGSVPAATHSRSTGLDVREGVIEDLKLSGRFDVVTAFQTIEHFADPLAFLSNIRNLLKPGGLLVLTTPDRRSLLGKLMGKRWFGYFNDEHLFFYDCGSFQKSIEKAGFSDVVVSQESGRRLTPSWVLTRLLNYYYTEPGFMRRLLIQTQPGWRWFDAVHASEPAVDLVALAWNR